MLLWSKRCATDARGLKSLIFVSECSTDQDLWEWEISKSEPSTKLLPNTLRWLRWLAWKIYRVMLGDRWQTFCLVIESHFLTHCPCPKPYLLRQILISHCDQWSSTQHLLLMSSYPRSVNRLGHHRFEGVEPMAVIFPESGGWSSGILALKSSSVWGSARLFIYTSLEQPLFGIRVDKKCLIKWNSINQQNNLAWKSWHRALILIECLATHLYLIFLLDMKCQEGSLTTPKKSLSMKI